MHVCLNHNQNNNKKNDFSVERLETRPIAPQKRKKREEEQVTQTRQKHFVVVGGMRQGYSST
jgi:hypothetical protein